MKTFKISFPKKLRWSDLIITQTKVIKKSKIIVGSFLLFAGVISHNYFGGIATAIGVSDILNEIKASFKIEKIVKS